MTNKVLANYKQSLIDLKEINDELFYDDLKERMQQHLDLLHEEAKKSDLNIGNVQHLIDNINYKFQDQIREATIALKIVTGNLEETITSTMQLETKNMYDYLEKISNALASISDDQKQYIETEFIPKADDYLTQIQLTSANFQENFSYLQEEQEKYIEERKLGWIELASNVDKKHEILLRKVEKMNIETIQIFQTGIQQAEDNIAKLLSTQDQTLKKSQQHFTKQRETLQTAVSSSNQIYKLAGTKQQELKDSHSDKLVSLINIQDEQGRIIKKWLIALSVSQFTTIGIAVGFYFF